MNKKATDILSYIGLIGWLIAFLAGDKENSKFHLNQGLVLNIVCIAVSIVDVILAFIPFIGAIVSGVLGIAVFVLWLLGIIAAANGEDKALPVIGGLVILK